MITFKVQHEDGSSELVSICFPADRVEQLAAAADDPDRVVALFTDRPPSWVKALPANTRDRILSLSFEAGLPHVEAVQRYLLAVPRMAQKVFGFDPKALKERYGR